MFNPMQMIQMFNQFKSSPMQALSQFGVPQNMNNPSQVIQYLMNSGKMSQQQYIRKFSLLNMIFANYLNVKASARA